MAPIGLCDLPVELLAHMVATYLTTKDLGTLRLTCKGLERILFDPFGLEFFSKKQFMLTTLSLQTLIDISKHKELAKFLKHVIIGMEAFHNLYFTSFGGSIEKFQKYSQAQADQASLIHTGGDREMLAEAFRNLPNLETIEIRDYSATGRVREGSPYAKWRSYGLTTIQQETGVTLSSSPVNTNNMVTRTFPMLIMAAADAGVRPRNLQAFLRHGSNLSENSFWLPERMRPKIGPVLSGLDSLLLTFSLSELHLHSGIYAHGAGTSASTGSLAKFLAWTPNLTHLRLNADGGSGVANFFEWFGEQQSNSSSSTLAEQYRSIQPIALPRLQRLDLGMTSILPGVLVKIIAKYASTLQTLSLWKIDLLYQFDGVIAQTDVEDRPNVWHRLLSSIMRIPGIGISHIMLGKITQKTTTNSYGVGVPVMFEVPMSDRGKGGNYSIMVGGKHASSTELLELKGETATVMGEAQKRLIVNWPPDPIYPDSEDGDSEDNEDEDEDMEDMGEPEGEDVANGN